VRTRAKLNVPLHREAALNLSALLNTLIARITDRWQLIAVQQRMGAGNVADIGGNCWQRIAPPKISVNASVRPNTEMLLIAPLGLIHLTCFVFGPALTRNSRRGY
jgi:hypothetical protein